MRLKELKKIVISELIQEYVGYDMFNNVGRAEEADAPNIHAIVTRAAQERDQHVASYMNTAQAQYAEIVRKIAPLLISAGVTSEETETFLEEFLTKVKDLVRLNNPDIEGFSTPEEEGGINV